MKIIIAQDKEVKHIVIEFADKKNSKRNSPADFLATSLYLPKALFVDNSDEITVKEFVKIFVSNYKQVIKSYIQESYSVKNLVGKRPLIEKIAYVNQLKEGKNISQNQKFLREKYNALVNHIKDNHDLDFYIINNRNKLIQVPITHMKYDGLYYDVCLQQSPISEFKDIYLDVARIHIIEELQKTFDGYYTTYNRNKGFFKKESKKADLDNISIKL